MSYLRIARNKFWAWVVVSLLVGLGVGVGVMFMATSSNSDEVRTLRNQARDTASQVASVTAALDAANARNTQLTLDVETANARIAALEDGSSTTTDTPVDTPTIAIVSRTVSPSSVVASQNVNVTMTAKVTGSPTKVTMYLKRSSGTKKAYTLKRVTTGTTETWRLVTHAPTVKGTYTYWAVATKGTVSVDLPGATAGKLTVK